jgi:drug/metabolite transporter (DMT)-like permease
MVMAGQETNELLMAGFLAAALLAWLFYAIKAWQSGVLGDKKLLVQTAPLLILAAAGNGAGNILVAFLSSRLSGAYLFPMVQGGILLILTLYSAFILREKLDRGGAWGIFCSVAAIVVMNL